jgi:hypothetical protein
MLAAHRALGTLNIRDDARAVVVVDATDVCQPQLACGALNQPGFESLFQLDELAAHGGFGHAQLLGGGAHAARLHDAHKDHQLIPVHASLS